jgi:hypothetical protein
MRIGIDLFSQSRHRIQLIPEPVGFAVEIECVSLIEFART